MNAHNIDYFIIELMERYSLISRNKKLCIAPILDINPSTVSRKKTREKGYSLSELKPILTKLEINFSAHIYLVEKLCLENTGNSIERYAIILHQLKNPEISTELDVIIKTFFNKKIQSKIN